MFGLGIAMFYIWSYLQKEWTGQLGLYLADLCLGTYEIRLTDMYFDSLPKVHRCTQQPCRPLIVSLSL